MKLFFQEAAAPLIRQMYDRAQARSRTKKPVTVSDILDFKKSLSEVYQLSVSFFMKFLLTFKAAVPNLFLFAYPLVNISELFH